MAIISDNDMEIILKGDQEETIRQMLRDRLFAVIKMPVKKPEKHTSRFSSSVFLSFMTSLDRTFGIRASGSKTVFENCEYYLSVYGYRGTDDECRERFEHGLERRRAASITVTYPTIDELLSFLAGKELFLITNYMHYGNFEDLKVNDYLGKILLIWKEAGSKFIRRDEFCDIRVFLSRVDDDTFYPEYGLYNEDVRNFDVRNRIVSMMSRACKEEFGNENYYSTEYEVQTDDVQAAYFLTRFHSNTKWNADPVNVVNARIAAYVLPGTISPRRMKKLSPVKKTRNSMNGVEYMISSIHFNSDVFGDLAELKDYVDSYFEYFGYD